MNFRAKAVVAAAVGAMAWIGASRARAADYYYTGDLSADWSPLANWTTSPATRADATALPAAGDDVYLFLPPLFSTTTVLNQDFTVRGLSLLDSRSGVSLANNYLKISGPSTLTLLGGGITVNSATAGRYLHIYCPLDLGGAQTWNLAAGTDLRIGSGLGTSLGGSGFINKTGAGTVILDHSDAAWKLAKHYWLGALRLSEGHLDGNNYGEGAGLYFRQNPLTLEVNDFVNTQGGTRDKYTWLASGEISGSVSGTVLRQSNDTIRITALGDATFAGQIYGNTDTSTTAPAAALRVTGIATQTFTGNWNDTVNGRVFGAGLSIHQGAGLTLGGSAALRNSSTGHRVRIMGGTFTLDNSGTNNANRLDDSKAGVWFAGGGRLKLIGNNAGTAERVGNSSTGTTGAHHYSGAATYEIVNPHAGGTGTELWTQTFDRTNQATVNIVPIGGTLGAAGDNPRLKTTDQPTEMALHHPWITVNGQDFTRWGGGLVIPAPTEPWASATVGDIAQITANSKLAASGGPASIKISGGSELDLQGFEWRGSAAGILKVSSGDFEIKNGQLYCPRAAPWPNELLYHVYGSGRLIVSANMTQAAVTKTGPGTLELSGANIYAGVTTINQGALRTASASAVPATSKILLRGGVLELGYGHTTPETPFARTIGPAAGNINWQESDDNNQGSGGFAAAGADRYVRLLAGDGTANLIWNTYLGMAHAVETGGTAGFLPEGAALAFGSTTATHKIEMLNNLDLGGRPGVYLARQIRVEDNPDAAGDRARISGVISSTYRSASSAISGGTIDVGDPNPYSDLLKTGPGTLELTGANTYSGGTIVAEGTLLVGRDALNSTSAASAGALGNNYLNPDAYVLVGARSGSADAALLTSGPYTVGRKITVQAGSSGKAILGGSSADASTFSADIAIGMGQSRQAQIGQAANKAVELRAAAGGSVLFSGGMGIFSGYQGVATVSRGAGGVVTLNLTTLSVPSGTLTFAPGLGTVQAEPLAIPGGAPPAGRLNLTDNDLIVGSGSMMNVRALLRSGAIYTSSTLPSPKTGMLGYAAGNDANLATAIKTSGKFGGQAFDADSVLVKYTYAGDADLDGDADGNDIGTWALNFTGELGNPSSPSKFWTHGDWDYDGDVDGNDAGSWALNFTGELGGGGEPINAPGASPEAVAMLEGMGFTVVPEPGTLSLLAAGAMGLWARRSRRAQKPSNSLDMPEI